MIKIETLEVCGFKTALHGMRNPKNSWERSDTVDAPDTEAGVIIGEADKKLAMALAEGGPVHAKYRRMITAYANITAPMYWWAEFDTYKVGTVRNSCSKMHKLLEKPFEMSDFSFDKLPGYRKEIRQYRPEIDEETEQWKPCTIAEEYDVSNQGRLRRKGRIIAGCVHNDGYIFVYIHGKRLPLHRLVAMAFIDNAENKPEVNHIDGNKQNNFVENLEWVTSSENQQHAVDSGLQPKNLKTYAGKFDAATRQEIKDIWNAGGISKRELAKRYNVSHTCICDIINDKYAYAQYRNVYESHARPTVDLLNELRDSYLECEDEAEKKELWYSIIQLLPESYNQKATVQLNYEVLANICKWRRGHKLDEWREFVKWAEGLPYAELFLTTERRNA